MKRRLDHRRLALSRRDLLKAGGGAAVLSALAAAGCSASGEERTVDLGRADTLRILTWLDYIDPDLPGQLQASLGLQSLIYDELWEDNQSGYATWQENQTGWDIVVPTYWLAAEMIDDGLVEQIPLELIPNHVNIEPTYLTPSWDRGARFHMPWQAGITGIAWNTDTVNRPITSIADLFSGEFDGRVAFNQEMREVVGLAMLLQGNDPSRPTAASADQAMRALEDLRAAQQIRFVGSTREAMRDEQADVAMFWSGDVGLVAFENEEMSPDQQLNLDFAVPDEGGIQWFDTMVIPKGSPNIAAAAAWMNEVYRPEVAAQITAWVGYVSPVIGVQDALRTDPGLAELADDPLLFPTAETRSRLFTWGQLGRFDGEAELEARFQAIVG